MSRKKSVSMESIYTTQDAAKYLGISVSTLYMYRRKYEYPKSIMYNGIIYYRKKDLDHYLGKDQINRDKHKSTTDIIQEIRNNIKDKDTLSNTDLNKIYNIFEELENFFNTLRDKFGV